MPSSKEALIFQINQGDLRKLLTDVLGIVPNSGSAFFTAEPVETQSDSNLEYDYNELLENEDFLRAIRIASQPDLYVVNRIGGGSMGISEVRIHRKKSEGAYVVATAKAADGTCDIQLYENYKAYLSWWMRNFAGKNEEPVENYLPMEVTMEQFLFLLHAIDSFRMVSYRNLLNHIYTKKTYVKYTEFTQTMVDSIKSKDIRWLLPSFMAVLPGFEKYKLNITAENAAFMVEEGLMENARLAKSKELVLAFGEGGLSMGVEFFRFWMMSSGFEINVSTSDGFVAVERLFNATTAIGNHFVQLKTLENGKVMVNHQTYTKEQLEIKLGELFNRAFTMAVSAY